MEIEREIHEQVGQAVQQSTESSKDYDSVGSVATNVEDGFSMVAVGDVIVSRALTKGRDNGFGAIIKILQDADVTFGNMESLIFDIRSFKGSPQAEYGGAYMVSLPEVGPDLRAMGFNIMSRATNHSLDWGVEGMRETSEALDQNGIIHAGVGENLAQAGAARFLETPRGRVGLVSFASSFTPLSRAADPAGEAPGRPGLNPLRVEKSIVVPPQMLESLAQLRDALPGFKRNDPNGVWLAGVSFVEGAEAAYTFKPHEHDVNNILRNIRRGKQFSDFCIATNHGHWPGNWSQEIPDYERSFAYRMIDAGADAYLAHGPHQLRGIEVYKGRPIFYGLGNFIADDLRTPTGADMFAFYGKDPRVDTDAEVTVDEVFKGGNVNGYGCSDLLFYESVVTVSRYELNQLAEIRLYPIELGHSERLANRGVPRLATGPQANDILKRLQNLSEPFGTVINIADGVGSITLTQVPPSSHTALESAPYSVSDVANPSEPDWSPAAESELRL